MLLSNLAYSNQYHIVLPTSFSYSSSYPTSFLPLYQCRNTPRLREFAEIFAVPACEFGDAIRHGFKAEPPATPHLTTEEGNALLCYTMLCPVLIYPSLKNSDGILAMHSSFLSSLLIYSLTYNINYVLAPCPCPSYPPPTSYLVLAALAYTDEVYLKRPEDVLRAVSVLLANELCLEPSIRHAAKVRTCVLT